MWLLNWPGGIIFNLGFVCRSASLLLPPCGGLRMFIWVVQGETLSSCLNQGMYCMSKVVYLWWSSLITQALNFPTLANQMGFRVQWSGSITCPVWKDRWWWQLHKGTIVTAAEWLGSPLLMHFRRISSDNKWYAEKYRCQSRIFSHLWLGHCVSFFWGGGFLPIAPTPLY